MNQEEIPTTTAWKLRLIQERISELMDECGVCSVTVRDDGPQVKSFTYNFKDTPIQVVESICFNKQGEIIADSCAVKKGYYTGWFSKLRECIKFVKSMAD